MNHCATAFVLLCLCGGDGKGLCTLLNRPRMAATRISVQNLNLDGKRDEIYFVLCVCTW